MTTLHMDVDACRASQSNLMNTREQLATQVTNLAQAVDGMVGSTWIAPAATEFQTSMHEWRTTMNNLLEQLATLGNRLNTEIADWEANASKLA